MNAWKKLLCGKFLFHAFKRRWYQWSSTLERRLRDATTEHEAELNRKIKALEKENYELEEYKGKINLQVWIYVKLEPYNTSLVQYEKVKDKLEHAELQIDDLKQRLDDALGAEDLVEQLTEQNLSLKEKLEEMKAAIEDLEALKELADELEENHIETEKQLQAEIGKSQPVPLKHNWTDRLLSLHCRSSWYATQRTAGKNPISRRNKCRLWSDYSPVQRTGYEFAEV